MISRSFVDNLTSYFYSADPETLSDRELFETAQRIGGVAVKSRRAFIGLLPLIERRRVYEGRTFYSIYDFAAKVGGVSRDVVEEVMRLDAQLREFPLIQKLLYGGRVGWSKIRMITAWLLIENQQEWIQKLENLSNRALEVYLRDYRRQIASDQVIEVFVDRSQMPLTSENNEVELTSAGNIGQNEAGNFGAEIFEYNRIGQESQTPQPQQQPSQPSQPSSKLSQLADYRETFTFSMRSDIAARLRLFRQKLEKDRRELVTWEEVMAEFLKMIEGEIRHHEEKKRSQEAIERAVEKSKEQSKEKPATRYIPSYIRHQLDAQYEGLCAFKDCTQPATSYHHTHRFALTAANASQAEVHDPRYLKPLCTTHERIIHNTLIENEECDASIWKLLAPSTAPDSASERGKIDQQVQQYRKPT